MKDGIYLEVFIMKDGARLNYKTISLEELTKKVTTGMCDGIEKAVKPDWIGKEDAAR